MRESDFIKNEIMKTGFPVEMEILSFLNSRDWFANPSEFYFDFDMNVARNIDIRATPFPYKSASNFCFYPFIAIECKKSEVNAWVFFESKLKKGTWAFIGQYADLLKSQDIAEFFEPTYLLLDKILHYNRMKIISMSYTQVKLRSTHRNTMSKNEIFEATNQVIKYVCYEIENYLDAYRNRTLETGSFVFFFPIIVFDGKLYVANYKESSISLRKAKHVSLVTFYKPKYENHRIPFWIDIVTRKYFPTYLSMIEMEIDNINKKLEETKDIGKSFLKELGFRKTSQ